MRIMIFQKRPRCQGNPTRFSLGSHEVEHTDDYTHLGLRITSTLNLNLAVNDLREKGRGVTMLQKILQRQIYPSEPGSKYSNL